MKLYNIFQEIILEEQKHLLVEGVLEDIKKGMEGSYDIWLKYKTPNGTVTDRYIELDKMGTSLAGNSVVRLYQKGGQTTGKNNYGWKMFRLDRIVPGSIRPTNKTNYRSVGEIPSYTGPKYNKTGDKLMKGVITKANYKYKE
jgi:hypothetical protein